MILDICFPAVEALGVSALQHDVLVFLIPAETVLSRMSIIAIVRSAGWHHLIAFGRMALFICLSPGRSIYQ